MKIMRRISNSLLLVILANNIVITRLFGIHIAISIIIGIATLLWFTIINLAPRYSISERTRLEIMYDGYELASLFTISILPVIAINVLYCARYMDGAASITAGVINIVICLLMETIVLLNGIIRMYITSSQLGLILRVLSIIFAFIPPINIFILAKICCKVRDEYIFETAKNEVRKKREGLGICDTKYPILMVHGVFFRDLKIFNYWGRIPDELKSNGARIYYGEQQSAATVMESAEELKKKIELILKETGAKKVNIIAHSKGGLDSRYAISCLGMDEYVASLSTINTPHRGCEFADYLLKKAPDKVRIKIETQYNKALKKLGDSNPDFLGAVTNLTVENCKLINDEAKDSDKVYYQSFMSKMNTRHSDSFPLNKSYILVHAFSGDNDGLVDIESAKWGESFKLTTVEGKRGISHGDVIDLRRENIKGFDVREFYVELVSNLKKKGF